MKKEIAGKGPRKPQLDISVNIINLDPENPRIVPYTGGSKDLSELDLTSVLYENFDTQVIAMSLAANGYFDEEPIIIVPNNIPDGFLFSDYPDADKLAKALSKIIEEGKITFTVSHLFQ